MVPIDTPAALARSMARIAAKPGYRAGPIARIAGKSGYRHPDPA
jgi:hypothetical protein